MFRTLIYPSSGACDCVDELPHRSSCSQFVVCWRFGAAGFGWCSFCRQKLQPATPRNAMLTMLLLCVRSYMKSVLRRKFFILDTYRPVDLCLREQGCEDPWLFFEAKRGP